MSSFVHAAFVGCSLLLSLVLRADDGGAKPFAEGVISTPQSFSCVFSPDGNTVHFARLNFELKRPVIMRSSFEGGKWSEPVPLSFSRFGECDLGMAPDGTRLFFCSARPMPGKPGSDRPGVSAPDLWYVNITASGYSEPIAVGAGRDGTWTPLTVGMLGNSIAADGTIYCHLFDFTGAKAPRLKTIRLENGIYTRVEDLGDVLNGKQGGVDPFIDPEQRFIIFASDQVDPNGGLWVSYHSKDGWTEPQNLGVKVSDAFCPVVTPDRKSLVFSRGGKGIFIVPLSELNFRQDLIGKAKM